jgi:hypothetical protein
LRRPELLNIEVVAPDEEEEEETVVVVVVGGGGEIFGLPKQFIRVLGPTQPSIPCVPKLFV